MIRNSKRRKDMSKTETAPEAEKFTKKYEVYNDDLELTEKEVEVSFAPASDLSAAITRLGNEDNKVLAGCNVILKREALRDARAKAGVSGGINRAVLMEYLRPYRELPQFASMIASSDKRKATAVEWNAQTAAICEQIKNVPFIMSAIKAKSAQVEEEE